MSAGHTVIRLVLVVVAFAGAGALAGVAWERWWQEPEGFVYNHHWIFNPSGPDVAFSGTALYVAIAVPVGLVLGALSGLLRGREWATLVAVLLGATVAAVVMYAVGHALGPGDPRVLALEVGDFESLPGNLVLDPEPGARPWASTALVAFPAAALAGLSAVLMLGSRQARPSGR